MSSDKPAPQQDHDAGPSSGRDAALVSAITQVLNERTDGLDGATRSRLTQARAAAMAARARQQRHPLLGWMRRLVPSTALGSGLAATALVTLLIAVPVFLLGPAGLRQGNDPFEPVGPPTVHAGPVDELEIVLAGDIEMLEDLEFFEWLATQPVG